MWLGYNTNGFAHHRLLDAIELLAEFGYQGVALTLDYHALDPYASDLADQVRAVRQLQDRHGLRYVIETGARFLLDRRRKHQPTLVSATASERAVRLDFLRRAIELAHQLNAEVVSFWSGTALDSAPATMVLDRLVAGCRTLCDLATPLGIRLAFEPEPGMFIDTMARYEELLDHVNHPHFGLTLDIGHLQCLGELPISSRIVRHAPRLWNVHIEDMKFGVHDHLPFGEGEIDFADVFAGLRAIDYRGGLCVELSRHSHNAIAIAQQSLDFLRHWLAPEFKPPKG